MFLCTTIVLVSVGMFLYDRVGDIVLSSVDRTLHSKLQIITGLLHEEKGRVKLELSEIIAGEYVIPRSGHYYRVTAGNGIVAASPSLAGDDFDFPPPAVPPNRLGETTFTSTGPDGEPVRVLRYGLAAFDNTFTVTLAESLTDSYRMIRSFKHFLQIAISLSIAALCLIAWWIVRSSLRPLAAFSTTIETITHKNLTERIDTGQTARELSILARSFNALLDRLHHMFVSQRRLLADASHQLKTPLSVMKTQCDVVLQRMRTPEEYAEALQTIQVYTQNMTRLINNLLSLARLDAGLIAAEGPTSVSLRDCIEEAIRLTKPPAEERGVQVISSINDALCVTGSRTGLAEAFLNLIENSIRYNRRGGSVTVNAAKEGNKAVVTITDTGTGIREEDRERIFERFYRAGTAGDSEGTGLGLSIVKSVISAHGGEIKVQSEPGRGSCFTVVLPLPDANQAD